MTTKLAEGTQICESGAVVSVKDKTDRRNQPFTGVTFKGMDGYLYWFRLESYHERPRVNFPIEAAGYVSGETPDGELRFLEDVRIIDPSEELEERERQVAEHWTQTEAARDYNTEVKSEQKAKRSVQEATPTDVPGAIYTVVFNGDSSDYETVRIHKQPENSRFAPGKTLVEFLSGPENTFTYTGFGFLYGTEVSLWNRFKKPDGSPSSEEIARKVEAIAVILNDPKAAGIAYAKMSGKCCICNRTLTVPESIDAGIGPVCANGAGW